MERRRWQIVHFLTFVVILAVGGDWSTVSALLDLLIELGI